MALKRLPRRPVEDPFRDQERLARSRPKKLDGGLLFDIKLDPFERSDGAGGHFLWY